MSNEMFLETIQIVAPTYDSCQSLLQSCPGILSEHVICDGIQKHGHC